MPRSSQNPGRSKKLLADMLAIAGGSFLDVQDAARALRASRPVASKTLSRLERQGWLSRIRRGLYYVLPLEAGTADQTTVDDPWLLAKALYEPCYIAGWSAAEHWGLTEQIFHSTFVATSANIRNRKDVVMGVAFKVVKIPSSRFSGIQGIWRANQRMLVSNRERTIVDALRAPSWVGGIKHLSEIVQRYHETIASDFNALVREIELYGNGAAAKRLGFMIETLWNRDVDTAMTLLRLSTKGIIKLDPNAQSRGKLNKKWGMWVNVDISTRT